VATIAEVAEDIFPVNLEIPGAPIDVSFFLICDEQPTLVETASGARLPTLKGSPLDYLARSSTTHLGVRTLERLGCRAGTPYQAVARVIDRPPCGMRLCPTCRATSAAR
jgi:hypothetical protein